MTRKQMVVSLNNSIWARDQQDNGSFVLFMSITSNFWPLAIFVLENVQNRVNVIISVRSTKRKCGITKKAICMSFVLVIIIVALSLALYFKSRMHFQNSTDQSESGACNETIPNCNGRITNGTFTTELPIRYAKNDS